MTDSLLKLKNVSENLGFQNLVRLVWKKISMYLNLEEKNQNRAESQNAQSKEDGLLE